jgi:hypothetical protein
MEQNRTVVIHKLFFIKETNKGFINAGIAILTYRNKYEIIKE